MRRIGVDIRKVDLPDWVLAGDYEEDMAYRARFQAWVTQLWQDKDQRIEQMLQGFNNRKNSLSPDMASLSHKST